MWNDKKMPQIYETIRNLDEQIKEVHLAVSDSIECAIQLLDCGPGTDRATPDITAALEMLQDARKELSG